jgi:chromate transporter
MMMMRYEPVHPTPHDIVGAALGLFGIFLPGVLILLGALPFWDAIGNTTIDA